MLLLLITIIGNDFSLDYIYVRCPNITGARCVNPIWMCPEQDFDIEYKFMEIHCLTNYINPIHKELCDQGLCSRYMEAGEIIGKKPNYLQRNLTLYIWFLGLGAFFINHIIFVRKQYAEEKKRIRRT